ncbi:alpha-mannosidase [Devosia pacifica]|uniref:Alpha-mannosidase n=1 Tax=Devosia pacifica TaxID=1335967 RepID=A0A918VV43_9HYPH|nr:alpha-mannosidase [Devosia pacifica]GHA27092.1 alpha-mannosidase [Devosia pacifica]
MRAYRDRQRSLKQLQEHLATWAHELAAWEIKQRYPIEGWRSRNPEGTARDIANGDAWDNRIGIHEFSTKGLIAPPKEQDLELCLDFTGETMVRLFDESGDQIAAFGANPRHPRFAPVPRVPFRIEAHSAARTLFGIPQREPKLGRTDLVAFYPDVRALRRRVEIACNASEHVSDPELARALCEAVEIGLQQLRLPTATSQVGPRLADRQWAERIWERSFEPGGELVPLDDTALSSVKAATEVLDEQLADLRRAYPKQGQVLLTGHAHIDYAWLWPQPETVRKIERTFANVNELLKAHPDFTFLQSSSLFYRHIEELAPELLKSIQQHAAEGRWEAIGGMLIECDTNMPSAEAFVRQFLLGQQDFERYFGTISRTAWLPDTFGFTAAMPQIMRHTGIDALVTIKVTWNETNPLPENIFIWQGNDGSEVLTHTYDAYKSEGYNMWMTPGALNEVWSNHRGKDLTDTVIATYGWGDGGGGPDPDQIEELPIINLMPAIPHARHGNIQQHLDQLRDELDGVALPRWHGEMYLEYHRATLTTQGRTKQLNRRAEFGLVAAEALAALAALSGIEPIKADLAEDWVLMLRNQFHDILPGSSIREVYEQTEAELSTIVERAEALAARNLSAIAEARSGDKEGLAIANLAGTSQPHSQIVSSDPLPEALSPQQIEGGYVSTIDTPLEALSVSFVSDSTPAGVSVSPEGLENALVRVGLDAAGRVVSLFDKRCGRELVDGAANRLMLYRNDLPRRYDAWDVEPGFELHGEELTALDSLTVTAEGPHLGEITVVRKFGASTVTQRLRLWANSARLEFVTDIDWHDRRLFLRAESDLAVLAGDAQFDQAIGVMSRATHTNTTWQAAQFEACGHRFVSISETDWGGALLSSDKYGFSAKGSRLTISLVRGAMYPDMLADEGAHHFTYALLPHDGRWWSETVQAEADLIASPLRFAAATADENYCIRPIEWQGQHFRFHALKPAEDGNGYVLRVSESAGRRGAVSLKGPQDMLFTPVDGLERDLKRDTSAVRPLELMSFRLHR